MIKNIEARNKFPILPYDPLTLRRIDGWPLLVPFSLDNPSFSIFFEGNNRNQPSKFKINSIYPSEIKDCYSDNSFTDHHRQLIMDKNNILVSHTYYIWETFFTGLIPSSIIPIFKKVKPLFDYIYIIAEVNNYIIKKQPIPKPKPVNPDPLVVGYYGGQLYLIAAFDLTPLEMAYTETTNSSGVRLLERGKDSIMIHQIAGLLEEKYDNLPDVQRLW